MIMLNREELSDITHLSEELERMADDVCFCVELGVYDISSGHKVATIAIDDDGQPITELHS